MDKLILKDQVWLNVLGLVPLLLGHRYLILPPVCIYDLRLSSAFL